MSTRGSPRVGSRGRAAARRRDHQWGGTVVLDALLCVLVLVAAAAPSAGGAETTWLGVGVPPGTKTSTDASSETIVSSGPTCPLARVARERWHRALRLAEPLESRGGRYVWGAPVSPVAAEGLVVISTVPAGRSGRMVLHVLDARTGAEAAQWSYEVHDVHRRAPALVDGEVHFLDGWRLHEANLSTKEDNWTRLGLSQFAARVLTPTTDIVPFGWRLLIFGASARVVQINPYAGPYPREFPPGHLEGNLEDGLLFALRPGEGWLRWVYPPVTAKYSSSDCCAGAPVVRDDLVLATTLAGVVFAVVAEDGTERWRVDLNRKVTCGPTLAGALLLVADGLGGLRALDVASGRHRWILTTDGPIARQATVADEAAYVVNDEGWAYGVTARTGHVRWRRRLATAPQAKPVVTGELLLVVGKDGVLYGLERGNGGVRWRVKGVSYAFGTTVPAITCVATTDGELRGVEFEQ